MEENPTINVPHLFDSKNNTCRDELFLTRKFFSGWDFQICSNSNLNQSYCEGRKSGVIKGMGASREGRGAGLVDRASKYRGIGRYENADRVSSFQTGVKHLLKFYYY